MIPALNLTLVYFIPVSPSTRLPTHAVVQPDVKPVVCMLWAKVYRSFVECGPCTDCVHAF